MLEITYIYYLNITALNKKDQLKAIATKSAKSVMAGI